MADAGVDADVVLRHGQLEVAPLGRLQTEPLLLQHRLMVLRTGSGPKLLKLDRRTGTVTVTVTVTVKPWSKYILELPLCPETDQRGTERMSGYRS